MGLDVEIDCEVCRGSGHCTHEAPSSFELDEDGIAFVVEPRGPDEEKVIAAVRRCPTHAISVRRDGVRLA